MTPQYGNLINHSKADLSANPREGLEGQQKCLFLSVLKTTFTQKLLKCSSKSHYFKPQIGVYYSLGIRYYKEYKTRILCLENLEGKI